MLFYSRTIFFFFFNACIIILYAGGVFIYLFIFIPRVITKIQNTDALNKMDFKEIL